MANKYVHADLSGAAAVLLREAASSSASDNIGSHIFIASEDMSGLLMQLIYTSTQSDASTQLSQNVDLVGRVGFAGSMTHLAYQFQDAGREGDMKSCAIPSGCLAHYADLMSRSTRETSLLNGQRFLSMIEWLDSRQSISLGSEPLDASMTTAVKQVDRHGRLDRQARMAMLDATLESQSMMTALGSFVLRVIAITGAYVSDAERRMIEALESLGNIELVWISTDTSHHNDSRFQTLSSGPAQCRTVGGFYAAVTEREAALDNHSVGVYLHQNQVAICSQLFAITLSLVGAATDLANRMEWYVALRTVGNQRHESAVDTIKRLQDYRNNGISLTGVDECLGRTQAIGRFYHRSYQYLGLAEDLYREAFDLACQYCESTGKFRREEMPRVVREIDQFFRWMTRTSKDSADFYLMASLYPFAGGYPKDLILTTTRT